MGRSHGQHLPPNMLYIRNCDVFNTQTTVEGLVGKSPDCSECPRFNTVKQSLSCQIPTKDRSYHTPKIACGYSSMRLWLSHFIQLPITLDAFTNSSVRFEIDMHCIGRANTINHTEKKKFKIDRYTRPHHP